jgi:hypothetical protein
MQKKKMLIPCARKERKKKKKDNRHHIERERERERAAHDGREREAPVYL